MVQGATHHGGTLEQCKQQVDSIRYPTGNKLVLVICWVRSKKYKISGGLKTDDNLRG